jgi:hypothetical protein
MHVMPAQVDFGSAKYPPGFSESQVGFEPFYLILSEARDFAMVLHSSSDK